MLRVRQSGHGSRKASLDSLHGGYQKPPRVNQEERKISSYWSTEETGSGLVYTCTHHLPVCVEVSPSQSSSYTLKRQGITHQPPPSLPHFPSLPPLLSSHSSSLPFNPYRLPKIYYTRETNAFFLTYLFTFTLWHTCFSYSFTHMHLFSLRVCCWLPWRCHNSHNLLHPVICLNH